jgi:hypothetical protein
LRLDTADTSCGSIGTFVGRLVVRREFLVASLAAVRTAHMGRHDDRQTTLTRTSM